MVSNKTTVNFAGGEVSPGVLMRIDLPIYNRVLARMQNFVADPKGPATYRQGSVYEHHTKNNGAARFIEFQFSDQQSYLVEAGNQYFRFHKDNGVILNSTTKTITGITKANPAVVTSAGHGYTNGQEVYITGVAGMTEVNGRYFIVASSAANTFALTDVFGNNINSSSFTTYTSGGTAANVYEISTPYLAADLEDLAYDQNADTMYIVGKAYEPRKLTRVAHDSWTLATYTRTSDPFPGDKNISTITKDTWTLVTFTTDHGYSVGQQLTFSGIVGTTQMNGNTYVVGSIYSSTRIRLNTLAGAWLDSTGFTNYVSGGVASLGQIYPSAVGFTTDSRLEFGGSSAYPERMNFSRAPSAAGVTRFDDFTTGSDPLDAIVFTLAPIRGKVDAIRWIANTDKYTAVGTFGSIRRMYGATEASPVEADAVTAKSANSDGVFRSRPAVDGSVLFYISRSQLALESIEYNYAIDGYEPDDKNLISNHLTLVGIKQVVRQVGRPTMLWVLRTDGVLLGLTYKAKENITGWHQHRFGGSGFVEYIGVMPRVNAQDQLWLIVRRTINGNTVRYIEYMSDQQLYSDRLDYFTYGIAALDDILFANYQYEVLKYDNRLDCALQYDGAAYGRTAGATLTPGAGATSQGQTGVTFTASAAVFTSSMVGRELWGKYASDGTLGGKATITGYTNSTTVTCTITRYFDNLTAFAAGNWYITATSVSGLQHLENTSVRVIADGFDQGTKTVSNGAITIASAKSSIWVGFPYTGILKTLPIDIGGLSGPAVNKNKTLSTLAVRFVNTQRMKFGMSIYDLKQIDTENSDVLLESPGPLYTGEIRMFYEDGWAENKELVVYHDDPVPCTVAALDFYMETADE